MRDLQMPRDTPGVGKIIDRAASSVRRIGVGQVVVHLHRQTDDVVPGGLQNVCGSRGVDSARHRDGDLHLRAFKQCRVRRLFRKALILQAFPSQQVRCLSSNTGGKPLRVLVVDDDPSIRRMIMAALRRDGYTFSEAANGKEALEIMRQEHPSVVVLDLMMPIVSGWDVLRERASEPALQSIPVIIVSANRGPELATAMDKG